MTDPIIQQMRLRLVPSGTAGIVHLRIENAFFKSEFITQCINEAEQVVIKVASGLDDASALERLAFAVLADSAYVEPKK